MTYQHLNLQKVNTKSVFISLNLTFTLPMEEIEYENRNIHRFCLKPRPAKLCKGLDVQGT